jgi:hypothetical protein
MVALDLQCIVIWEGDGLEQGTVNGLCCNSYTSVCLFSTRCLLDSGVNLRCCKLCLSGSSCHKMFDE